MVEKLHFPVLSVSSEEHWAMISLAFIPVHHCVPTCLMCIIFSFPPVFFFVVAPFLFLPFRLIRLVHNLLRRSDLSLCRRRRQLGLSSPYPLDCGGVKVDGEVGIREADLLLLLLLLLLR